MRSSRACSGHQPAGAGAGPRAVQRREDRGADARARRASLKDYNGKRVIEQPGRRPASRRRAVTRSHWRFWSRGWSRSAAGRWFAPAIDLETERRKHHRQRELMDLVRSLDRAMRGRSAGSTLSPRATVAGTVREHGSRRSPGFRSAAGSTTASAAWCAPRPGTRRRRRPARRRPRVSRARKLQAGSRPELAVADPVASSWAAPARRWRCRSPVPACRLRHDSAQRAGDGTKPQ